MRASTIIIVPSTHGSYRCKSLTGYLVPRYREPGKRRLGRYTPSSVHEFGGAGRRNWSTKGVHIETAKEVGFTPGQSISAICCEWRCADTDEKAIDIGRTFMWTETTASEVRESTTTPRLPVP